MSTLACSNCGAEINDASPFCSHCGTRSPAVNETATPIQALDGSSHSKACPYCGENILAAAIKCRFCSSDLRTSPGITNTAGVGGINLNAPANMGQTPSIVIQNVQAAPAYPYPHPAVYGRHKNPGLAAVLSLFLPGAGQCYNGHIGKALLFFFTAWLIIPWIWSIFDAYSSANRINQVGF